MIHNMTGGGAGLNLKVVGGTTQPNGKDNLIWVNTDTDINGYAFSADEPASPAEGMVWFVTGASSSAAMNVDKKNTVMLYPIECQQYIGGSWVEKNAQVYMQGKWVSWAQYIYKDGFINTSFIGGLSALSYAPSTSGSTRKSPSVSLKSNSIRLTLSGTSTTYTGGSYFTNNAVDLTDYSKLCLHVVTADSVNDGIHIRFGTSTTKQDKFTPTAHKAIASGGSALKDETLELDISSVNGLNYLYITLYGVTTNVYVEFSEWGLK